LSAALPNTRSTEVIREKVQDGVTGETRDMQYTQCKIVGNGSFGVVFQTKLSPSGEDAAIKSQGASGLEYRSSVIADKV
jgi:glycogen synthase kinase 3 beta